MRVSVRVRVLACAAILCAAAAGCGDNENVDINLNDNNDNGNHATSTPRGRTPTPARTATVGGATATAHVATATVGNATPTATSANPSPSPTSGGNTAQVETATDALVPFFTIVGFSTSANPNASALTTSGGGVADAASGSANCPAGGTRNEVDALPVTITVTLTACRINNQLGNFQFDGTIVASLLQGNAMFNVSVQDLTNQHTVMYSGTVTGSPTQGGGFVVNGGPITITTPQGNFTLTANNVTVDSSGTIISGSGTVVDTDDNFDLQSIMVTIRSNTRLADVVATFDDNSTQNFVLNLDTGVLTPGT